MWNLKNKLLKRCVLWMIDSRIHRNMKIARGGSVPKTRLLWPSTQYIIIAMTGDRPEELGSQFLRHLDFYHQLLFCPVLFWTRNYIYLTSVRFVQALLLHLLCDNLSERKNLHKSESPFSFLFGDIRLCSPQGIKISWITALDMFSNLCLVLLLLLARSLVQ